MYTVKKLAETVGLAESTIRYYRQKGLLKPQQLDNGYYMYEVTDAFKINRLRTLCSYGFSVEDAITYMTTPFSDGRIASIFKNNKELIEKEIRYCEIKALKCEQYIKKLEMNVDEFQIVEMEPPYFVLASNELDFSISTVNKEAIADMVRWLPASEYAILVDIDKVKEAYQVRSFGLSILATWSDLLSEESLASCKRIGSGKYLYVKCVSAPNTSKVEEQQRILAYIEKHNLVVEGDWLLIPDMMVDQPDLRIKNEYYLPLCIDYEVGS